LKRGEEAWKRSTLNPKATLINQYLRQFYLYCITKILPALIHGTFDVFEFIFQNMHELMLFTSNPSHTYVNKMKHFFPNHSLSYDQHVNCNDGNHLGGVMIMTVISECEFEKIYLYKILLKLILIKNHIFKFNIILI